MSVFRRDPDSGPDNGRNRDSRRGSPRGGPPRRTPGPLPPGRPFRTLAFWTFLVLLALVTIRIYQGNFMSPQRLEISYTRFIQEVERGNIQNLQIIERTVTGELKAESSLRVGGHDISYKAFKTNILGDGADLPDRVWKTNPAIEIEVRSIGLNWFSVLLGWLPALLLFGMWIFFMRQMQAGGSAALKFGKTKAKVLLETSPKVTFKDVAGCDEAKQELQEIIEFLKEPQKFQRLGGRIPKGALLLGPPGSGKTLLAKAVAGEAAVPFFSMSGSDFVEMFVGVGASVTGDTPVLMRRDGRTRLMSIGEFVDGCYPEGAEGYVVPIEGVETLGFEERDSKFKGSHKTFVEGSAWSRVGGVFRHRAHEICEIHYLGGMIRTTPDHSVFIRTRDGIKAVAARDLEAGDVLVNLPLRVRGAYSREHGTPHAVRAHRFEASENARYLEVQERDEAVGSAYAFAVEQQGVMSQAAIGAAIGVSQMTVSNWQAARREPRAISTHYSDHVLPGRVELTPDLMRLFGYYTAEGRENGCLEFTFGTHESDLHADCIAIVERIFGVKATVRPTSDNRTKIVFYSAPLGRFFARHCGTGSHEKRVPECLWDLPREHFDAYLTGYALGDGYITPEGKLSITSVSHRLIRELTWLCAMHGIKAGVRHTRMPAGRVIKSKPLPETEAWNLIIGKTSHNLVRDRANQGKRPVVRKVVSKPYDGYVYDLCGCENEAFFGGEKPILLHNSRVRDLFEQGKRNAPCLTGDAVITLSGGRQVTIREMFQNAMVGVRVPAMTSDFRFEDAQVLGITRKPSTDLYRVTTSTSEIKATGNHLFPVLRGPGMEWVRADQLTESDCVAVPRCIGTTDAPPLFYDFLPAEETLVHFRGDGPGRRRVRLSEIRGEIHARHPEIETVSMGVGGYRSSYLQRAPLYLNEDIAYLCGLLASDGCYGSPGDRSIPFINTEVALHERVDEILGTNFGYSPRRHLNVKQYDRLLPQGTYPQTLRDCYTTFINNRLLCDSLRAAQSRILEMPSYLIASWLRGVFDGDGCVRLDPQAPQIIISAWDHSANQLIRDALLRAGIVVSFSRSARAGRDGNIVMTGRETITRFAHKIQSDHPAKAAQLHALLATLRERNTSASRLDSVPATDILRRARQSVGMGQRAFSRGHYVSTYERGRVAPSRTSLQAVVEELEQWCESRELPLTEQVEDLRDLAHSAVLWSRVQNVVRIQSDEPVYDLCLDRHNCFVANNIVVHNCILFIDEIDAVGRHRGAGLGGGHDEREQTLNQLLVEMDGFDSNEGVIMIAATNRPDVLDPALMRPGRFDRQIVVDWPDVRGREGILRVHTRKIPLSDDVDLKQIARATPGLAGADIANLVNEAALLAARRNRKKVTDQDFEDAKDKVMLGMERRSLVMTEEERRTTAYHEAGHALVALLLLGADPVDKVTIIPRGRALGVTSYIPSEERHTRSKEDLLRTLCKAMGGRAAEYLIFNHLTTGAANDIEQATGLARKMVCELGMSDKLGPLTFGKKEEMVFLGREIASHKDYSEQTAVAIDEEVRAMVEGAYKRALELLGNNTDKLHLLASTLLEREVLDRDEMERLLRGEKLEPVKAHEPEASAAAPGTGTQASRPESETQVEPFAPPTPRPAGA